MTEEVNESKEEESKESHEEKVARIIEYQKSKKNTREPVKKKEKLQVLTLTCPHGACSKPVQLLCPYCQQGALECDEHSLALVCNNCHNSLHQLPCPHCHFILKPSYIYEKQHHLKQLIAASDGSKFLASISTFIIGSLALWFVIYLAS